jgi:hypothetical protein
MRDQKPGSDPFVEAAGNNSGLEKTRKEYTLWGQSAYTDRFERADQLGGISFSEITYPTGGGIGQNKK